MKQHYEVFCHFECDQNERDHRDRYEWDRTRQKQLLEAQITQF